MLLCLAGSVINSRNLGNAHARNNAGRAYRSGANADLDSVSAGVDQGLGRFGCGYIAGNDLDIKGLLDLFEALDDILGMAMGRVKDKNIDIGFDQSGSLWQRRRAACPGHHGRCWDKQQPFRYPLW